ncbi:MAG: hypothetical protein AB8E15_07790 [Bdellovibrionales bacterium]
MKFTQHSFYSNDCNFPKVNSNWSEKDELLLINLAWGDRSIVGNIESQFSDYYLSTKDDNEATSPFEKILHLPTMTNNLIIGLKLVNESVYKETNKEQFVNGLESLAFHQNKEMMSWVSVGEFQVYVKKAKAKSPSLYFSNSNLASEFDSDLPPLPKDLVGTQMQADVKYQHLSKTSGDTVVIVKSNKNLSHAIESVDKFEDASQIAKKINKLYPDTSFWIGLLG